MKRLLFGSFRAIARAYNTVATEVPRSIAPIVKQEFSLAREKVDFALFFS